MAKIWMGSGPLCAVSWTEAFPFLQEKGHTVSLVGAGGKTSLMFALAEQACRLGRRVLVSTTTHIFQPQDGYVQSLSQAAARWAAHRYAVVGQPAPGGKLSMLPPEELRRYMDAAELVLLEADGSKRLPLKVPADREPVLLPESDILIAVCGLRSLGAPLEQICFRLEQAQELLGKSSTEVIVTEADLVRILTSERGGRKGAGNREYYMVLNQCDDAERLRSAGRIAEHILHKTGEKTIATCLKS